MGNRRKIVVVGTSNVGSAVVNKLADFQLASEIVLIDLNQDKAWGEATDSSHATACVYSTNIKFRAANIVIICAGPSIRPGETPDRLKLAGTNAKIMNSVFRAIAEHTKEAVIILITNPLDVATYVVSKIADEIGYPRNLIMGTGTMLETYRFRRILANKYEVDPKNINGYVLGEHGNAAFVAWSTTGCAGFPLEKLDDYFHHTEKLDKKAVEQELIQVAYDVINRKGYTNTGVAMAAVRFVKSVLYDEHTILPCSAIMNGEYGITDVALSMPRMVCADGLMRVFEVHLTDEELENPCAVRSTVQVSNNFRTTNFLANKKHCLKRGGAFSFRAGVAPILALNSN